MSDRRALPLLLILVLMGCERSTSPTPPGRQSGASSGEPTTDRVTGWQSDIDFLLTEIHRQHYIYKSRPLPEAFDRKVRELKDAVPCLTDERMLLELQGLMKQLGDGHCYLLPMMLRDQPTKCLPIQLYAFSDGLFVVGAEKGHERWLGRRIERLGPTSAANAMRRVADFASRDNEMGVAWVGPFLLRFRGMLEVLGLEPASAKVRLGYRTAAGNEAEEDIDFIPVPRFRGVPKLGSPSRHGAAEPPLYLRRVSVPFWFQRLGEDTLYVQFNQVMNGPDESLVAFARRLDAELGERPPALLVVDVRHNNGGNADLLPPLVAALEAFETKQPTAKLVIITGRNTFSAAQIFISQVNHATRALFAGEMSSSKPNFVGEENEIILPWSKAMGSISNRYHETIPGDSREGIAPELKVEASAADYFANRDAVLDAVRRSYAPPTRNRP
jgi:hypothetical protein